MTETEVDIEVGLYRTGRFRTSCMRAAIDAAELLFPDAFIRFREHRRILTTLFVVRGTPEALRCVERFAGVKAKP